MRDRPGRDHKKEKAPTMQVLCATMHQNDFSKIEEMRIESDVIFANQTKDTWTKTIEFNQYTAEMISTQTRGVGRNRNIALLYASADILLFADDDVVYADGYRQRVLDAYRKHPDADMIIFSMDLVRGGKTIRAIRNKDRKMPVYEAMRYGTYCISVRRSSWKNANLWFSLKYGGGADFSHGEDTLFLLDAVRNHWRIYTSSALLGTCSREKSTCFRGYTPNYFFDLGVFYEDVFPAVSFLIASIHCQRHWTEYRKEIRFQKALKNICDGIRYERNSRKGQADLYRSRREF